jgi:hypothetical protein
MATLEDEIIHGSNSKAIRPPNPNMHKWGKATKNLTKVQRVS